MIPVSWKQKFREIRDTFEKDGGWRKDLELSLKSDGILTIDGSGKRTWGNWWGGQKQV